MIASAGARRGHSDNPLVTRLGEDTFGPLGVPLVDVCSPPVGHEDSGVLFQATGGAADDSSVGTALGQALVQHLHFESTTMLIPQTYCKMGDP